MSDADVRPDTAGRHELERDDVNLPGPAAPARPRVLAMVEDGRAGEVALEASGLNRLVRRPPGLDDRQIIPFAVITSIAYDRTHGVVVLRIGRTVFEWVVDGDAEWFIAAVHDRLTGQRSGARAADRTAESTS